VGGGGGLIFEVELVYHDKKCTIILFIRFVLLWTRVECPHKLLVSLFKEVIALQFDVLVHSGYCSNGNGRIHRQSHMH